jgi:hypothetical protein
MTTAPLGGHAAVAGTIETRRSWLVAWSALGVLSISFGAPLITVVALKPIAAEFGNIRSVPALSYALAWLGSAAGGIVMGLVAEQVGVRWTVIFGVLMIAAGLLLSSLGGRFDLYLGHGLFMGLLGNAGIKCAALCLCRPLVRSSTRDCLGADRKRTGRRRDDLGTAIRPRDRMVRMATHDADLCSFCGCRDHPRRVPGFPLAP